MTPGEQVPVVDHRGALGKASGSSYAVPRIAAMAARLLAGHPDWVFDVDFSPDGSQLLVGARDGAVLLWQVAD